MGLTKNIFFKCQCIDACKYLNKSTTEDVFKLFSKIPVFYSPEWLYNGRVSITLNSLRCLVVFFMPKGKIIVFIFLAIYPCTIQLGYKTPMTHHRHSMNLAYSKTQKQITKHKILEIDIRDSATDGHSGSFYLLALL